jgi:hypothetical protein
LSAQLGIGLGSGSSASSSSAGSAANRFGHQAVHIPDEECDIPFMDDRGAVWLPQPGLPSQALGWKFKCCWLLIIVLSVFIVFGSSSDECFLFGCGELVTLFRPSVTVPHRQA